MGLLYLRGKMPKPQPIQISIPNPCTEDWSKMTPAEQGRFCSSCQKCVVDFTGFSDKQLYEYLQAHKTQQVCGRFYDTQLNRTIHIPPQPHSALYRYFIGLGLTLILAQIPIEEVKAITNETYLLADVTYTDDSTKRMTDTARVYIVDGVKIRLHQKINICMGAIDQVEVIQSGTPAKYSGQENYKPKLATTTERNNLFRRNK